MISLNFSSSSISSLPSPPPTSSGGKKTHAFFSSPWPSSSSTPTPPPHLEQQDKKLSKTSLFFQSNTPTPEVEVKTPTPTPLTPRPVYHQPSTPADILSPPPIHVPAPEEPREGTIISTDSLWPLPRDIHQPQPARPKSPLHQHHFPTSPSSPPVEESPLHNPHPHHHSPRHPNLHSPHLHAKKQAPPPHHPPNTTLKLISPLGHGAFSSVWLAEDLSPLPLVLRSRRSLRDLRRKASLKIRPGPSPSYSSSTSANGENSKMRRRKKKDELDIDLGRADSLRRLRDRVPGVRPIVNVRELFSRSPSSTSLPPVPGPIPIVHTKSLPNPHSPTLSSHGAKEGEEDAALSRASSVSSTASASTTSSRNSMSSFNSNHSGNSGRSEETEGTAYSTMPVIKIHSDGGGKEVRIPASLRPGGGGRRKELRIFVEEPENGGEMLDLPPRERRGSTSSTRSSVSSCSSTGQSSNGSGSRTPRGGRLVAVKMTVRSGSYLGIGGKGSGEEMERERERTRVAFVREVEVLRHISHPSITPLLSFLSTPTHHLLVLPYLPGGDLLSLVNSDTAWERLRESVVKRIWTELVGAVGWMHSVGIVHRDVKLENILLTTSLFTSLTQGSPAPVVGDLPEDPLPVVKVTDFGLSRFVDIRTPEERRRDRCLRRRRERLRTVGASVNRPAPDGVKQNGDGGGLEEQEDLDLDLDEDQGDEEGEGPWLTTRCGSEAYAAPELIMAPSSSFVSRPSPHNKRQVEEVRPAGAYDGRETDSWACGVVLYALMTRRLPFGEGAVVGGGGTGVGGEGKIGREGEGGGVRMTPQQMRSARRAWLMRIARGEYEWPEVPLPSPHANLGVNGDGQTNGHPWEVDEELMGPRLVESEGARRVVGKLLVRDPRRRARVGNLWSDIWMGGSGEVDEVDEREKGELEDEVKIVIEDDDESVKGDDGHDDEDQLMHDLGDDGVVDGLQGMDDLSVEEELRLMEQLEDELEFAEESASATSASTHPGDQPRLPYHKHRHLVQDWVDMLEEGGFQHQNGVGNGEGGGVGEGGTVSRGGSLKSLKGRQQTRGWLVEEDNIDDVARREVV